MFAWECVFTILGCIWKTEVLEFFLENRLEGHVGGSIG